MAQEFNRNHRDFSGNVTRHPRTRCKKPKRKTRKDREKVWNMSKSNGTKTKNLMNDWEGSRSSHTARLKKTVRRHGDDVGNVREP